MPRKRQKLSRFTVLLTDWERERHMCRYLGLLLTRKIHKNFVDFFMIHKRKKVISSVKMHFHMNEPLNHFWHKREKEREISLWPTQFITAVSLKSYNFDLKLFNLHCAAASTSRPTEKRQMVVKIIHWSMLTNPQFRATLLFPMQIGAIVEVRRDPIPWKRV